MDEAAQHLHPSISIRELSVRLPFGNHGSNERWLRTGVCACVCACVCVCGCVCAEVCCGAWVWVCVGMRVVRGGVRGCAYADVCVWYGGCVCVHACVCSCVGACVRACVCV